MKQLELVSFILRALEKIGVPHMVVGSFASGAYGEPRFTQDIDIVVEFSDNQLDSLIAQLPPSDFYVSRESALQAIQTGGQFNVIHPESGVKIDFMIAGQDAWGREQMARRTRLQLLDGLDAYVARPEDIIISKMSYYREGGSEKHLRDITGMFDQSGDEIDRAYLQKWVDTLDLGEVWNAVQNKLSNPGL